MPTITEPPAVHVDYVAPASCPPLASFVAGLSARGVRVSDAEGARRLSASVSANGSEGYVGSVSVAPDGAERHVRGQVCTEVVSALAFVASLEVEALDRQAATPKDPASSEPKEPEPNTATASADDGSTPRDRGAAILESLDLGADAAIVAGPLPSAAFALPLFVEAGFPVPRALPLRLRLRFQQVAAETNGPAYGARFTVTTGSFELAAMLWESGRLRAFAGVRADAGALVASGSQVMPALSSSRPWVTVGPDVRCRLVVAGPFFAELDVGIPVALTRDRFFVEPDTTVHRPGVVGAAAGLGLGFSIF